MAENEIRPVGSEADRREQNFESGTDSSGRVRCTRCGIFKQVVDMAPDRRRKSGHRSICRECRSAYDRARYETNPGEYWAASYRRRARQHGLVPVEEHLTPEKLKARWGDRCYHCGAGPFEHTDHVTPVAAGGLHVLENVVPSCRDCNLRKRWHFDESEIRRYRSSAYCGSAAASTARSRT